MIHKILMTSVKTRKGDFFFFLNSKNRNYTNIKNAQASNSKYNGHDFFFSLTKQDNEQYQITNIISASFVKYFKCFKMELIYFNLILWYAINRGRPWEVRGPIGTFLKRYKVLIPLVPVTMKRFIKKIIFLFLQGEKIRI